MSIFKKSKLSFSRVFSAIAVFIALYIVGCDKPVVQSGDLPPLHLFPVKQSKTYVFSNDKITDSAIFNMTFDSEGRLISRYSVLDDAVLDLDYSNASNFVMKQRTKSTGLISFITNYRINSKGQAIYKFLCDSSNNVLNKSTLTYNSKGNYIQEFAVGVKDSILIHSATWLNECVVNVSLPNSETNIESKYTQYPDLRNMGFWQFLRNTSYYLVDTQKYITRGSTDVYKYSYEFDSLRRPIKVYVYLNSVKLYEKYYTYY